MKIVFVDTTMDGPLVGGAHTFLVEAMRALTARDHEVHFISKGVPRALSSAGIEDSGAQIHSGFWNGSQLVEDAGPQLGKWVNQQKPAVFVVSVSPDIGWTVLPHLDPSIATLTIGHNDEETFYAPVRHYAKFLTRAVGVSEEICRKYVEECGMPAERVDWIPYGVETSAHEPATSEEGPLRLVYVGRFDSIQKRIGDVVSIIKRLGESGVDFRFDLVGDGQEMANVRSALADEMAVGRVVLHGWVESEKVIEILRASEVFVLASAYEGFCISLIEAMANGCCPVVSDIASGNKQLVEDGVSGFILPIGDIDGFVGRIRALADDREKLGRMRMAAWKTGREYGVERMVDNYVACFERAVEDARVNPRKPDPAYPLMPSCRSKYPLWLRRIKAKFVAG